MIDAAVTAIENRIDSINIDQAILGAMSGDLQEASASDPPASAN